MSDSNENTGKVFDEKEYQKFMAVSGLVENYYSDSDSSYETGCGYSKMDANIHPSEPNHECPLTELDKSKTPESYYVSYAEAIKIGNETNEPETTQTQNDPSAESKDLLDLEKVAARLCFACKLNYRCHNRLLECMINDSTLLHKAQFLDHLQMGIDYIGNCGCYLAYDY